MEINNFDKIYCINLNTRKDRKDICDSIFKNLDLKVEYIEGVDGSQIKKTYGSIKSGHKGCCLSHRKIYNKIFEDEAIDKVLILEDDIEFHPMVKELFTEWYEEVPENWHMLYFGGNHNGTEKDFINKHVHVLKKTFTTHCYALRRCVITHLINEFRDDNIYNREVDVHLSRIQQNFPCYGFFPHIAWQRESFSDIEMKSTNYKFLR